MYIMSFKAEDNKSKKETMAENHEQAFPFKVTRINCTMDEYTLKNGCLSLEDYDTWARQVMSNKLGKKQQ